LVPYKGADIALTALVPFLQSGKMRFDIIGNGPMLPSLRKIIRENDIEDSVQLHGWVPHHRIQGVLSNTRILVFPSVREFGGGVVLEAMAMGIVPIVVDYAGPGELVDVEIGIKVPLGTKNEIISSIRGVIEDILQKNYDLDALSICGEQRIESKYTWEAKASFINELYLKLGMKNDGPTRRSEF
jgi:glycosyltransferase involved in cell wall biosynthesis